jgi:zinc D-Ala-D-Ala carboxypeptidase
MKISKHLTLAELTYSETAIKLGIVNQPNKAQIDNLIRLAEKVFEPAREHFNVPIHISSGYRIINLNQAIKGSVTSQHCKGEAIDIDMKSAKVTNAILFHWIKDNLKFDQIIAEHPKNKELSWVHVSYSDKNRQQILVAKKVNGKTVYFPYKSEKDLI